MADKKVRAKDLRGMPEPELRQNITQARQEIAGLRVKAVQGSLEQPHQIAQLRRSIARMMTVLNEPARRAAAKAT